MKKQISEIMVALVLFLALMTHIALQFVHLFEDHEHHIELCDDHSESHIHKYESKCELCCNFLTPLNYELTEYSYLVYSKIIVKSVKKFTPLQLHFFKKTNTQLRAPPTYS